MDKILYNGEELCTVLGVNRRTIDALEKMTYPLPFIEIPGYHEHLYPAVAVNAWALREVKRQAAERATEQGG